MECLRPLIYPPSDCDISAFQTSKISKNLKGFQAEGVTSYRSLILILFFDAIFYAVFYGFSTEEHALGEVFFWLLTVAMLSFSTVLIAVVFTPNTGEKVEFPEMRYKEI